MAAQKLSTGMWLLDNLHVSVSEHHDSQCQCCQPLNYTSISVSLLCEDGFSLKKVKLLILKFNRMLHPDPHNLKIFIAMLSENKLQLLF